MRPCGTYGDVARALLDAAAQGPATRRALAERAGVGYRAANYTATRLVEKGELVCLDGGRPAVLARPDVAPALRQRQADGMDALVVTMSADFWAGLR